MQIRKTHSHPGPTSVMSGELALKRKIQTRITNNSQFFGHQTMKGAKGGNTDGQQHSGVGGNSGSKIYFSNIFPRMRFNNTPAV